MPIKTDFSKQLKEATSSIHTAVESHPFMKKLLDGSLDEKCYHQHLIDLESVYRALEEGIRKSLKKESNLSTVYVKELERADAIQQDLQSATFAALKASPSPAAQEYVKHLNYLATHHPLLLLAHAYVRYLGDLSGGMILKKRIEQKWPDAVHFYDFSALIEKAKQKAFSFKESYKDKLDDLPLTANDIQALVNEAHLAFEKAQSLFDAIPLN
ncbi:biliverdin-producing heme oxygenase [Candidatus Protochlamydia phocaeensis]|uniref:biliverdin-producing heme oxygenase n=1 Tax=Candidatus Protochlamydia phocaeensis TaxID=1414722 RepID=UPI000837F6B4|nr:biliverdin-producing heme oxygenase [Candidatus Protochlamydia phocaeensis]